MASLWGYSMMGKKKWWAGKRGHLPFPEGPEGVHSFRNDRHTLRRHHTVKTHLLHRRTAKFNSYNIDFKGHIQAPARSLCEDDLKSGHSQFLFRFPLLCSFHGVFLSFLHEVNIAYVLTKNLLSSQPVSLPHLQLFLNSVQRELRTEDKQEEENRQEVIHPLSFRVHSDHHFLMVFFLLPLQPSRPQPPEEVGQTCLRVRGSTPASFHNEYIQSLHLWFSLGCCRLFLYLHRQQPSPPHPTRIHRTFPLRCRGLNTGTQC